MQALTILLALSTSAVLAKKNAQEEAICQPFLTSRATSPLMPNLNRNITYDEDGEFACELVLQDVDLPVQIRATIHEGLGWLAIRHIQMGLVREKVAARHFSLLAELSPKTFDFAYKAGMFMLAPSVSNIKDALKYLERAISNADPSKVSPGDFHQLHHLNVKALRRAQRHEEAEAELYKLLERYPYDFETLSVLKYGSANAADHVDDYQFLDTFYRDVQVLAESEYIGFRPPCSVDTAIVAAWQPTVYTELLSAADFAGHVERREPFIVRLGSARNLNAALGSVCYIAKTVISTKITLERAFQSLPAIGCNVSQLNQVFLNLINNAAQAIEGTGTVTVSTQTDGRHITVSVRDTGRGIPADVLPRIFEAYFTTKPDGEGTGLGLAIARNIVEEHGGDIQVSTELGLGTEFRVRLPIDKAARP